MTQFADLGAGSPRKASAGVIEDIHVTARAAARQHAVAYVDNDRVVLSHSRAFRGVIEGVAVVGADLTDPAAVLADPALLKVIDLAEPVALIFGLVLNLLSAQQAREVIAGYSGLVAPGSFVVISCVRCDDQELWDQLSSAYTAAPVCDHAPGDVEGFLAGLELVPPGLVATQNWRGGWHDAPTTPPGPVYVLAGVARKAIP